VIIALGDIYAQVPRRAAVSELMRATQTRVREQPGCISYEFAETLDEPGHFLVVQRWRDLAALEQHYRSQAFATYQEEIAPQLTRTSQLRLHAVSESFQPVGSSPADPRDDD
jgi:quinol monooxygenase YgiN